MFGMARYSAAMPICFTPGSYTSKGDTFKAGSGPAPYQQSDANSLFGGPRPGRYRRLRHLHRHSGCDGWNRSGGQASQIFKATLRKLAELE